MPEVGDLTPSEHDRVGKRTKFSCIRKKKTDTRSGEKHEEGRAQ